jgi:hypothetical protein
MPLNNFSIGKDTVLDIVGAFGTVERFSLITNFDAKQGTQQVKVVGMDGVTRFLELPDGWSGTLDIERQDDTLDAYIAQFEEAYYNGQNIQAASITETVSEPDGSLSQYRYTGVMFKLDDAGPRAGNASVKQKLSFAASRRLKVQ